MTVRILIGDVRAKLAELPDESVHCVVTSPPYYGLRAYLADDHPNKRFEIGSEMTWGTYITELVKVFDEVRRVLRDDGTLWLNLGDSYCGSWGARGRGGSTNAPRPDLETRYGTEALGKRQPGMKPKDLMMLPARAAIALQAAGWWLRSDIIWSKPNPMPESVTDRPTSAHEHIFLLAKSERYFFDAEAVKEAAVSDHPSGNGYKRDARLTYQNSFGEGRGNPMQWQIAEHRNIRNVWTIATQPYSEAHFATFPPALIEPCIKAGCPVGGTVLDCFGGAGTTGLVADRLGRSAILVELNPEYAEMARRRVADDAGMFAKVAAE